MASNNPQQQQKSSASSPFVWFLLVDSETGEVLACKALGEMLRWIAAQVPRQLGARNYMKLRPAPRLSHNPRDRARSSASAHLSGTGRT